MVVGYFGTWRSTQLLSLRTSWAERFEAKIARSQEPALVTFRTTSILNLKRRLEDRASTRGSDNRGSASGIGDTEEGPLTGGVIRGRSVKNIADRIELLDNITADYLFLG